MKPEDLKNVKLSPVTAGYLGLFIKLSDICCEASNITEMAYGEYGDKYVDKINEPLEDAISDAMSEAMQLAIDSIRDCILSLDNHTEL